MRRKRNDSDDEDISKEVFSRLTNMIQVENIPPELLTIASSMIYTSGLIPRILDKADDREEAKLTVTEIFRTSRAMVENYLALRFGNNKHAINATLVLALCLSITGNIPVAIGLDGELITPSDPNLDVPIDGMSLDEMMKDIYKKYGDGE